METFKAERERGEAHRMHVTQSEFVKLHADIATLKPAREVEEAAIADTLATEVERLQQKLDAERVVRTPPACGPTCSKLTGDTLAERGLSQAYCRQRRALNERLRGCSGRLQLREQSERQMRVNLKVIVEGLRATMAEQKIQRESAPPPVPLPLSRAEGSALITQCALNH